MPLARYRYELRRGDTITSTGHISYEALLEIGECVTIGASQGIVREIGPNLPDGELRLVVQLLPDNRPETA